MEFAVEHTLRSVAVLVILLGLLQFALLLIGTGLGIFALFVAGFAIVRGFSSGTALLALGFLSPRALDAVRLSELLWLVGPASLLSVVLFDLALDGLTLRLLRLCGLGALGIGVGEVVAGGTVAALTLIGAARFVPGAAGLSVTSALVAGLTGSFVLYYIEMASSDAGSGHLD